MDENIDDIMQIDAYLSNTLSEAERKELEQRLGQEPDFAQAFDIQLKAYWATFEAGRREQFNKLKGRFDENQAQAQVRNMRQQKVSRWVAIAAGLLILAAASFIFFQNADKALPSELYLAEAQATLPSAPDTKSGDQDSLTAVAHYAFNQKSYTEAINAYEELIADSAFQGSPKVSLFLGLAYLQENRVAEAREQFQQIPQASTEYMEASWFTALSYLKEENIAQTKSTMAAIAQDGNHFYQKRAQDLLDVLE